MDKSRRGLPLEVYMWISGALITEIYPEIRLIAVSFSKNNELLLRYYLDREPTEYDYESIDIVMGEITANTSCTDDITKEITECIYSTAPQNELDSLDECVYARREYNL